MPSIYNQRSTTCAACSFRVTCIDLCRVKATKLTQMRNDENAPVQFGLRAPKNVKRELTSIEKLKLATLPKKVQPRYESMVRRDFDRFVRNAISVGSNPFVNRNGARFLEVACDRLLITGATSGELKTAFQSRFGWTSGTAASHASICMALLPAINAAKLDGKRLVLMPKIKQHHQHEGKIS